MDERRKKLLDKIRGKRSWLLNFHKLLSEHDPEMLEKWDDLYSTGKFQTRSISPREKELVDLAISTIMKWAPGLQIHIKKSLDMGITEREITEIFSLSAMSAGIPCMMFASDVYSEMKKNNFAFSFPQWEIAKEKTGKGE